MSEMKSIIADDEVDQLVRKEQPDWMEPMLATLSHEPFDDESWLYERKLDGERCLVFKHNGELKLMSRNKKSLNAKYPEIVDAFASMEVGHLIVDGEIVAFEDHVTSFSRLQKRMHMADEEKAKKSEVKVYYYAFDLMYAGAYDLTHLKLKERKKALKNLLTYRDPVRYTPHRNTHGLRFLEEACGKGWEGLIAKRTDSQYLHSRSKKWLKFKCEKSQEFVIVGYTDPEGERIGFGALLLAYYEKDRLRYAGRVGTGFTDDFLGWMIQELETRTIDLAPFDGASPGGAIHWVQPEMVCEVRFTEWTEDGKLRHPSFKGLREDKDPSEVTREDAR